MLAATARFQILRVPVGPSSYLVSERKELLMRPDFKFFDYPLPLRDDAAFRVAQVCRDFPVTFPGGKPSQKQFFSGADIWKDVHSNCRCRSRP